jgi:hypothetical protein
VKEVKAHEAAERLRQAAEHEEAEISKRNAIELEERRRVREADRLEQQLREQEAAKRSQTEMRRRFIYRMTSSCAILGLLLVWGNLMLRSYFVKPPETTDKTDFRVPSEDGLQTAERRPDASRPRDSRTQFKNTSPPNSSFGKNFISDLVDMRRPIDQIFEAWRSLNFSQYISQWSSDSQRIDLKTGKVYSFHELSRQRKPQFELYKKVLATTTIQLQKSSSTDAVFDVWYDMKFLPKSGRYFQEKGKESYVVKNLVIGGLSF